MDDVLLLARSMMDEAVKSKGFEINESKSKSL